MIGQIGGRSGERNLGIKAKYRHLKKRKLFFRKNNSQTYLGSALQIQFYQPEILGKNRPYYVFFLSTFKPNQTYLSRIKGLFARWGKVCFAERLIRNQKVPSSTLGIGFFRHQYCQYIFIFS
jgi:hypothetical protein